MENKIKHYNPTLHKYLFTITTFSKYLALSLFIILPFLGFYLGIRYEKQVAVSALVESEVQKITAKNSTPFLTPNSSSTSTPIPNLSTSEIQSFLTTATPGPVSNWKTYENVENGYSIKYPSEIFVRLICPNEELDLTPREQNDIRDTVYMPTCGRDGSYAIEIHTSPNFPVELQSHNNINVTKEDSFVDGVKGINYISRELGVGVDAYRGESLFVVRNGKTYGIYFGSRISRLQEAIDKMITTFKFTQ